MTRNAQRPRRSGGGTLAAGGGGIVTGGGSAALLVYYLGMPPEIAAIWALLIFAGYSYFAGTASTWARDQLEAGRDGLWLRLLSGLGVLVLAVGLGGCAGSAGPFSVEIWDTASLEVSGFGVELCLGCYDNAKPEAADVVDAPPGGAIIEPAGVEVLVRGVIVEPPPELVPVDPD